MRTTLSTRISPAPTADLAVDPWLPGRPEEGAEKAPSSAWTLSKHGLRTAKSEQSSKPIKADPYCLDTNGIAL